MREHHLRAKRETAEPRRVHEAGVTIAVVSATVAALIGLVVVGAVRDRDSSSVAAGDAPPSTAAPPPSSVAPAAATPVAGTQH